MDGASPLVWLRVIMGPVMPPPPIQHKQKNFACRQEAAGDVCGRFCAPYVGCKTRRVRKTRWYPASGRVAVGFDDILVLAGRSLPESMVTKLTPWDLAHLQPYQDAYLAGFLAERYQVGVEPGFVEAQRKMSPPITPRLSKSFRPMAAGWPKSPGSQR